MFLAHKQDITERYFFFSQGSTVVGKNEFISQYEYEFTASFLCQI